MGKLLLGIVLLIAGLISYISATNSPTGGSVWTGGMLVGAFLIYRGLRDVNRY